MLLTVRVLYASTAPRWPGAAILASAAATVATLHLNRPELVAARSLRVQVGWWPPRQEAPSGRRALC